MSKYKVVLLTVSILIGYWLTYAIIASAASPSGKGMICEPPAHPEAGDCDVTPYCTNPGAGCGDVGDSCTGLLGAGICVSWPHPGDWTTLIWCLCLPTGKNWKDLQEAVQKLKTTDSLGTPPYTLTFTVDETAPENIVSLHVSDSLGGGDFELTQFSGTIEVLVEEHPHADSVYLTAVSLEYTVPSFMLNNGKETGLNHITLVPNTSSGGAASMVDGGFGWQIVTLVTNDLFSASNPILGLGLGFGTFDFQTKTVTYNSTGLDIHGPIGEDIPTLTQWGLIIFGLVLIGFITYVLLRRRKAVVSVQ
ncbi:MAG: hypothetical protein KAX39_07290 [candidate division Zixibacteria bacterium]|nr:hypothetical protein [candidate division Zixibacteria bacterium]